MHQPSPLRALLVYTAIGTPIAVLVFLFATRFFASWDGYAVGMQPIGSSEPDHYRVLVVEDGGRERLFEWPAELAEGREIPVAPILAPPPRIPDTAPHTSKSRFTLYFLVDHGDAKHDVIPTTTPSALALALLVWILGLLARNMIVAGSPVAWEARPTELPRALPTPGQIADNRTARSKKGPPPARPRKGRGR